MTDGVSADVDSVSADGGTDLIINMNNYAQRGAVSIHLSEWDEYDPKRTGAMVYLYVSDADAVRAEWASCESRGSSR